MDLIIQRIDEAIKNLEALKKLPQKNYIQYASILDDLVFDSALLKDLAENGKIK